MSSKSSEQSANGYQEFVRRKSQSPSGVGFEPVWIPDFLFDFQRHLVAWAIERGTAGIFADCGLGKTPIQLVWAENIARKTDKNVLIVAPLAVAAQTQREADKFGIEAKVSRDGTVHRITITNYERLHYFKNEDFIGAVADESSAIKAFDGKRRKQVVRFFSKLPYRLLCTATPSPNDFIELGTQSECLGIMTQSDMLGFFFRETENMRHTIFKNDDFWNRCKWWFKPHSEKPFWRWMASWARALRSPSDLGFDGSKFKLPPLEYCKHVTDVPFIPKGELFPRPAIWLHEQREERHRTLHERCEKAAEILTATKEPGIAWCHYNEEGDLLEQLIPRSVQVAGSDSEEYKVMAFEWFSGYKCICNEPMFRARIAAWQSDHQDTGNDTTKSIENNSSINPKSIERKTATKKPGTHATTIARTNGCGSEPENSKIKSTRDDVSCMQAIQKSSKKRKMKSKTGEDEIQSSTSSEFVEDTKSPSNITAKCNQEGAPSVAGQPTSIANEHVDSMSITAMRREHSEDCSAHHAISDSGNSAMTPTCLSEPQCMCGHKDGTRRLVSKPKIACWGLNLQFCGEMTIFPSFSFEQFYQAVRRCWRFGRKGKVRVHVVSALGEAEVIAGLKRKQEQAEKMFESLTSHMNEALAMLSADGHTKDVKLPSWICGEKVQSDIRESVTCQ